MSTTVLGKRSRTASFAVVVPSSSRRTTRAKRRALSTTIENIENQPLLFLDTPSKALGLEEVGCDDENVISSTPKKQKRQVPPQQPQSVPRIPLSPAKVNKLFKASKGSAEQPKLLVEPTKTLEPPKTPRHRDSVRKPVTPRHRVALVGKPTTPRNRLFSTPTAASTPTVHTVAKTLFSRSSAPGRLIGREEERKELTEYLDKRISNRSGGCLYVSGPPGCGKSALLTEVMGDLGADEGRNVKKAYVNCMTMQDPKGIYSKLLDEFYANETLSSPTGMEDLEGLFVPKGKAKKKDNVFIVVLDEIDHLLTKDQEILYSVFEWALVRNSRLILIGIANALDLTDRFLPRLKARNLTPQLLPFLPYSAEQIASVITSRLRSLLPKGDAPSDSFVPFMHPAAIQLASRKVASATGDLRKAFDICRRAIELVEGETRQKEAQQKQALLSQQEISYKSIDTSRFLSPTSRIPLMENISLNSPSHRSAVPTSLNIHTAPLVTIAHVARISATSFGGSMINRVKALNLQQKAVLCCLVSSAKKKALSTATTTTIRKLFDTYTTLCKRERLLHPLTSTEFRDVVAGLEAAGVVNLAGVGGVGTPSKRGRGGPETGEKKITATVGEMELLTAVADVGPILTRLFGEA